MNNHGTTYITHGDARGSCEHHHRTAYAAAKCLRAAQRACERSGGYSDRAVMVLLPGGIRKPLDESDRERVQMIIRNMH